jgi:xanthine dehydrogenase small subunit
MRKEIRFLLGDEPVTLCESDPTGTVLDWLRLAARRTGTKEGCAEGDCGACTLVIGRLEGGAVRYEAVNSCIRFLPTLDGCQVLTVEHLKARTGCLHPIQAAMVAHHGSQCGFCTPGIVMSLVALWLNEAEVNEARIEDALAGNLCRCTGYRPIVDAALAAWASGARAHDPFIADAPSVAARLSALADGETLEIGSGGRRFLSPASLDALADLVEAHPDATIVAGATDVGLWITKELKRPRTVIWLGRVADLQRIEATPEGMRIGAGVSLRAAREALAAIHPHLDELLRRFGSEQIRNAGTIGGNIANGSPIGDLAPALIALGARLTLRKGATRREIPLEDFFLDYRKQDREAGEFVEAVTVPPLPESTLLHVSKISKRFDEDISALCGAFRLDLAADGTIRAARIAYGGMSGTPKRAGLAEAAATGRPWTRETAEAIAAALGEDYTPLDDWRASAAYRRLVASNLARRFFAETAMPGAPARVAGPQGMRAHA